MIIKAWSQLYAFFYFVNGICENTAFGMVVLAQKILNLQID